MKKQNEKNPEIQNNEINDANLENVAGGFSIDNSGSDIVVKILKDEQVDFKASDSTGRIVVKGNNGTMEIPDVTIDDRMDMWHNGKKVKVFFDKGQAY